ncbi:MAG TPA: hypothetical protein VGP52_08425 [Stellaceae bacterium]|jgi:hypothetical protein|nr:hypothetical protein [Stellaceae bacterium]
MLIARKREFPNISVELVLVVTQQNLIGAEIFGHRNEGRDLGEEAWNSPAMVAVRRGLSEGPLMPDCLKCPFHCA